MSAILPRFDFRADYAQAEDVGRERSSQEDVALIAPELALFAVADGMGGHQAGEVAAKLAIETLHQVLGSRKAKRAAESYVTRPDLAARRQMFSELRAAVLLANERVRRDAAQRAEHQGMGCTLDVVWLARDHAFVAHAGDGRVYLARARAVVQITQDHSTPARPGNWPGESAARHSSLTNAIGMSDAISVDTAFVDVSRGDRLLLCTDGVHGQLRGEVEIAELLRAGAARQAARALVARAAQQGRDNATAIVVEIGERLVRRSDRDRGLGAADLERASQSPLLVDLPQPFVLSALAAAVEIEAAPGESIPRSVASDLVGYIVLDGVLFYPNNGRRVGAGALVYPESLVGVAGHQEAPVAEQTMRLLRLRADDFAEVCSDPRLAAELYRRLAQHLARFSSRLA